MENKTGKYFKYAIGEIILVVIGILIALQINNWNEEQKRFKEEQKLIEALVQEIENNIDKVEESITVNKSCAQRSKAFIEESYSKESFEAELSMIPSLFCYTGNKIDNSILNEILGTNSRALISNEKYLDQLRVLKVNYERVEKTMNYVDSYWNSTAIDYFNNTGAGIYMLQNRTTKLPSEKIVPDHQLFSILGIMNGFQYSLALSQEDLLAALKDTLEFLKFKE